MFIELFKIKKFLMCNIVIRLYFLIGTVRGCTSDIPERIMNQLNKEAMGKERFCKNMTIIELGPDSKSIAVAMCACNTTNCNLGPPKQQAQDEEMIGATMPQTKMTSILPLTGLLINQCTLIEFNNSTRCIFK